MIDLKSNRPFRMVDLFAGAGGFSEGFARACRTRGIRFELTAINHWPTAVQTHALNHPTARHFCESVYEVDPIRVIADGAIDCLTASPECIYHSNARGGGECDDQSRSGANDILRWIKAIHVPTIVIENVKEFQKWGPLGDDKKPIAARAGETFREFCAGLREQGYTVEYAVLNSANYGAYTARERFFLIACKGVPFAGWPQLTHMRKPDRPFVKHWHAAYDIIDWDMPGESLALRQAGLIPGKKPLVKNTLDRIAYGLEHISGLKGDQLEPFLVMLYGTGTARSINRPLPSVTTSGNHVAIAQPTPMLVHSNYSASGNRRVMQLDLPLPTLTAKSSIGIVVPFLDQAYGKSNPTTLDKPLPSLTAGPGHHSLVEPFMLPQQQGWDKLNVRSTRLPLQTLTTRSMEGLIEPFYTEHYGNGSAVDLRRPLHTVTTHDRFSLCQPMPCDILYRLLEPHELAAGMGFTDYKFAGSRTDVKKQIGNAVEVNQSHALAEQVIDNWRRAG